MDEPLDQILALVMWKLRHALPAMAVRISQADRKAFAESLTYNEQTAKLNVEYRGEGNARVTIVHLTDAETGDQIVCTENNEADLDAALEAQRMRQMKQTAPLIAERLRADIRQGNFSDSLIEDACQALEALAR